RHLQEIPLPIDGLSRLTARDNSWYIVGASTGHLVVWDIRSFLTARIAVTDITMFWLLGNDQYFANRIGMDWIWGDVGAARYDVVGRLPPLGHVFANVDKGVLLFFGLDDSPFVVHRGNPEPDRIDVAAGNGVILDD